MYLIDTSVWIDFLRGIDNPRTTLLEGLLQEGEAGLCEVTFSEICFGARDENQYKKYKEYFLNLPFFGLPSNWHQQIAKMGFDLRKKGHKPFIADLMITLTALHHQMPLLSRDSDFVPYQNLFGLSLE